MFIIIALFALFAFMISFIVPGHAQSGVLAGYGLGLLAVILHFVMSFFTRNMDNDSFFQLFFGGLMVRFLLILGLFIVLIISEKFDQLSFTVSFLISYIFHSVIDMIFLNDQLTNQPG